MYSKSDNIEIMINDKADELIEDSRIFTSFSLSNWIRNINER